MHVRVVAPGASTDVRQLLRLNTDGTLSVGSGTTILATSTLAIAADGLWHRVDVDCGWNTSTTGIRVSVDGVLFASDSSGTVALGVYFQVGVVQFTGGTAVTADVYFDDVVFYDAALPAVLGDYNVGLLAPTSDNAAGGWKRPDGTTGTSLSTEVDNVPPTGNTSNTNTTGGHIENIVSSAADNYDAECETFLEVVGYSYTGATVVQQIGHSAPFEKQAQSFVWKGDAALSTIPMVVHIGYQNSPVDNLVVTIQADSAGAPSGTPLATVTFTKAQLGAAGTNDQLALFSTTLTPGALYWVVLARSGSLDTVNNFRINAGTTGFGRASASYVSGAWVVDATTHLYVTVGSNSVPSDTSYTVLAAQAIVNDAQGVTTNSPKAGAVVITANPSGQTEQSFDFGLPNGTAGSTSAAALGTFPSGWGTHVGPVSDSPSVTMSTGPTVRVGKRTATTREVDVDFLGVYVMYSVTAVPRFEHAALQAVSRASNW